jgi:hypothetical protein
MIRAEGLFTQKALLRHRVPAFGKILNELETDKVGHQAQEESTITWAQIDHLQARVLDQR